MVSYRDYEEEYRTEKKRLERLKRRQNRYLYGMLVGFAAVLLGFFLLRFVLATSKMAKLFIANMFYGPALLGFGLWLIWRGFINSEWKAALWMADRLHLLYTIPKQKEECANRIGQLRRRAERSRKQRCDLESTLPDMEGHVNPYDEELDWLRAGGEMPEKWEGAREDGLQWEKTGPETK